MPFVLAFSGEAKEQLATLAQVDAKKYKKVQKTLGYLQTNPSHHGLRVHKYSSIVGPCSGAHLTEPREGLTLQRQLKGPRGNLPPIAATLNKC
ncbi:hypothetical protein BH11GEM1_BH11GEM1_23230 [soil metagenome]